MGEVSNSFLVFAKLYNFWVQLDLSLNSECNGLCFIQMGAVEGESQEHLPVEIQKSISDDPR